MRLRLYLVLSLVLIAVFIIFSLSFVSAACSSGIISYWKFDENSGTTAYDSADGNNGVVTGATWTTGKLGSALQFNGNSYV